MNAFKKDYGIPKSEQAREVVKPRTLEGRKRKLDQRNVRLYIFDLILNFFGIAVRQETHLREDKEAFYADGRGNQNKHFNAGLNTGKLKDHYYYHSNNKKK